MLLIDTNIFLEIILEQKQADECQAVLDKIFTQHLPALITHYSIHSIAAILSHKKKEHAFADFIESLERMPSVHVYATTPQEEKLIAKKCRELKLDFDDALQYWAAQTGGCESILSLDSDFDQTDLPRMTPTQFNKTFLEKQK